MFVTNVSNCVSISVITSSWLSILSSKFSRRAVSFPSRFELSTFMVEITFSNCVCLPLISPTWLFIFLCNILRSFINVCFWHFICFLNISNSLTRSANSICDGGWVGEDGVDDDEAIPNECIPNHTASKITTPIVKIGWTFLCRSTSHMKYKTHN